MPDWTIAEDVEHVNASREVSLREELTVEKLDKMMLAEAYADLERLYLEDVGWRRIGAQEGQFTPEGRKSMAKIADITVIGNALIKRATTLRTAYIWGQGVTVSIRDDGSEGQDVNKVWTDFWEEPTNRASFTSSEAQARYERNLQTSGECFWALPTDPITGRVRVRRIPPHEITERITDPQDEGTVWFYRRVYTLGTRDRRTGAKTLEQKETLYPALGFYPEQRPPTWGGKEVRWDAPIRPVVVNPSNDDWRGVGDVLAALPWSRMDKEFLEDFAVYMRAMVRILGTVTSNSGAMAKKVQQALASAPLNNPDGSSAAGGFATMDPNTSLNLVSKSGAMIDADSHRPFATMVSAAMDVPLTMLLGDPGQTGARAVAETLDQPTELIMGLRRKVHTSLYQDLADYVIDQAVLAPRGPLRGGSLTRDGDRLIVELPTGDDRTVQTDWPDYSSTPLTEFVAAVADAEATGVMPDLEIFKLLAQAFGLEEIDDLIEQMTDDQGNFIRPKGAVPDPAAPAPGAKVAPEPVPSKDAPTP